jgi:hypothetical protein
MKTLPKKQFRSGFREFTFDGTRYALIMVLMLPRRGVQCSAIKDRDRSIGVYPVQPDGSRPRENVFTIYENKRIPKQKQV